MPDRVHCVACNGTGRAPLGDGLQAVLDQLRRVGPSTVGSLWMITGKPESLTRNAINNRCEDLRALGLVTRTKRGREYIYAAKEVDHAVPQLL